MNDDDVDVDDVVNTWHNVEIKLSIFLGQCFIFELEISEQVELILCIEYTITYSTYFAIL